MASFAHIEEFEARYGEADDRVEAWLSDASAVMRRALADSPAAWASDPEKSDEAPDDIKALCISLAFRGWSNPEGVASEQLGEHRVAFRRDAPQALELTDNERRDIRRAAGLSSFRSVTQRTPFSGDEAAESGAL